MKKLLALAAIALLFAPVPAYAKLKLPGGVSFVPNYKPSLDPLSQPGMPKLPKNITRHTDPVEQMKRTNRNVERNQDMLGKIATPNLKPSLNPLTPPGSPSALNDAFKFADPMYQGKKTKEMLERNEDLVRQMATPNLNPSLNPLTQPGTPQINNRIVEKTTPKTAQRFARNTGINPKTGLPQRR